MGIPSSCLDANTFRVLQCSAEFGRGRCFGPESESFEVPFFSHVYDPDSTYRLQLGCCTNISIDVSNAVEDEACADYAIPAEYTKSGPKLLASMLAQNGDMFSVNVSSSDGSIAALALQNTLNESLSPVSFALYTNFTSQEEFTRATLQSTMWIKGESEAEMYTAGGLVTVMEDGTGEDKSFRVEHSLVRGDAEEGMPLELYQFVSFVHGIKAPHLDSPVGGNQLGENRLMNCSAKLFSDKDLSVLSCQTDESTGSMALALEPGVVASTIDVFFETQSIIYEDNRRRRLNEVLTNQSCFGYLACVALADATTFLESKYEYELVGGLNPEENQFDEGKHEFQQEDSDSANSDIYVTLQTPKLTFTSNTLPTQTVQRHTSALRVDPPEILDFLPYYTGNQTPPARILVESNSLGLRNRTSEEVVTTVLANPTASNSLQLGTIVEESYRNTERAKVAVGVPLARLEDNITLSWSTDFSAETLEGGNFERKVRLWMNKTEPYTLDVMDAEMCLQDWSLDDAVSAGMSLYSASTKMNVTFHFTAQSPDGTFSDEVWTWYMRNFSAEEPFAGFEVWLNETAKTLQYSSSISRAESDWRIVYRHAEGPQETVSFKENGSFLQRNFASWVDYIREEAAAAYGYYFSAMINKVESTSGSLLRTEGSDHTLEVELFKSSSGSSETEAGEATQVGVQKEGTTLLVSSSELTSGGEEYWCRYMYIAGGRTTTGYRQVFQQGLVVIDLSVNTTNPFVPTSAPTVPTESPTNAPVTLPPTSLPTSQPTAQPTAQPTNQPTLQPTQSPSNTPAPSSGTATPQPSAALTETPTTSQPTTSTTPAPTPSVTGWVSGRRLR